MENYSKPLPDPDPDTQPFWDACRKHEVRAQQCTHCLSFRWPPQTVCPRCYSREYDWTLLKPAGVVRSFSVVHHVTVAAFRPDVPYIHARVTIDGTGSRVIIPGMVVDCSPDDVRIGMPVEIFFENVTSLFSLPKFRPTNAAPG
jgi:uncharacterized OB-fold protein